MRNPSKRFLFGDVETTGTNPKQHALLEVAFVITDDQLTELGAYESTIWQPGQLHPAHVSPFIHKMHGPDRQDHTKPCLLEIVRCAEKEAGDVEKELLTFFFQHAVEPGKGILAGASIHFDRGFLAHNMPLLEAFFYHRMFDVSPLKTAAELWGPKDLVPPPKKVHRAMEDVRETLELARTFKNAFGRLSMCDDGSLEEEAGEAARDFVGAGLQFSQLKKRIIEVAERHVERQMDHLSRHKNEEE